MSSTRSRLRRLSPSAIALLTAGAALAAPALAGSPPLPKTASAYESAPGRAVHVDLVTNATNAKRIQPGGAPLGAQFAVGGIYANCPKAPHSGSRTPFLSIPFPALTLKLSHGRYSFSKRLKASRSVLASSLRGEVKLTVQFSGTVQSSTAIAGTVKITGKPCSTTAKYSAKFSPGTPVAPGQ
ncbi:MAG TPA: hypothetical protein VNZ05_05900 [Solirubrobacteraceae bacterium]|nr:hypothetical protein [Solirubrobacteraceae bacterium]